MKKLIIFYTIAMATALNENAASSSSNNKSKNKQSTQKKAFTAILPKSIKIPGKRGQALEKVNLDAQDHITKKRIRKQA